jgi:hypothetical protein
MNGLRIADFGSQILDLILWRIELPGLSGKAQRSPEKSLFITST